MKTKFRMKFATFALADLLVAMSMLSGCESASSGATAASEASEAESALATMSTVTQMPASSSISESESDAGKESYITIIHGITAPRSDFLLPDSSSRYLTEDNLSQFLNKNAKVLHLDSQCAINEIYTRYGYPFLSDSETAKEMRKRYDKKEWYKEAKKYCPVKKGQAEELNQSYMNDIERSNITFIAAWQKQHDIYSLYSDEIISVLPMIDGITSAGIENIDLSNPQTFWSAMFYTLFAGAYQYGSIPYEMKEYSAGQDEYGNAVTSSKMVFQTDIVEKIGTILLNGRADIPDLPEDFNLITKNSDGYLLNTDLIGESWQIGHTRAETRQDGSVVLTAYRVEGEDSDIKNGTDTVPEDTSAVISFILRPKKTDIDADMTCEYVIQSIENADAADGFDSTASVNALGVILQDSETKNYYSKEEESQLLVSEKKLLPKFIGNDALLGGLQDELSSLASDTDNAAEDIYEEWSEGAESGQISSHATVNLLSLITFDDGRYVTLELKHQLKAGGPHGTEKDYYYVLDKKEGKQLKLSDVINNSEADFEAIFAKHFSEIDFSYELEKSAEDITDEKSLEDYQFYISDGELCIFFNRYDINSSYLPPEFSVAIPFSEMDMKISPGEGSQYNDWDYYFFE